MAEMKLRLTHLAEMSIIMNPITEFNEEGRLSNLEISKEVIDMTVGEVNQPRYDRIEAIHDQPVT